METVVITIRPWNIFVIGLMVLAIAALYYTVVGGVASVRAARNSAE